MQTTEICTVILRKEPYLLSIRGSIDVELLCENHHTKNNLIAGEDPYQPFMPNT